jgi:hypothetical protein
MKNIILLLLVVSPFFLKAQYYEWTPCIALTDSSHNNRNAFFYGDNYNPILFWDQELNSTTTQLCFRNIFASGIGAEQILNSEPGVKLTNPKILNINSYAQPPIYLVLYQTNKGKDIDLNAMLHQADDTFSQPVTVSELPGDDVNLTISEYGGIVAWQNKGKIWVSQYLSTTNSFTNPFAVDSVGTYSPVFSANSFNYLKQKGDSTELKSLDLYYNQGNWVISKLFGKSICGESSCLASVGTYFGGSMCMQNKIGTNPTGLILFDQRFNETEYMNSPNYNYTQPAVCDFIMLTKSAGSGFLAFVSDSLLQKEVFAMSTLNELQNISQWPGEDKNPKMFVTFPYSFIVAVNLLWESERAGYSTIYRSHYDYFFGGIAEKPKTETLLVKPCPFDDQTTIRFQATGNTIFRIFDLQGNEVKKLPPQMDVDGWQNAVWDGTNFQGNSVPSGSYLIVAGSGNEAQSRIIIKK